MKTCFLALWLLWLAALPLQAQDDDDDISMLSVAEPSCFGGQVRVSALISDGTTVRVGLVEAANKMNYLVKVGEIAGAFEVLDADYDLEIVTLRKGTETCTLRLAGDPNALASAQNQSPPENMYRGEAIEKFLKENPNAIEKGLIKFPPPILPATEGKGEGIENFLKTHPEIKIDEDVQPGTLGSGIAAELHKHPELTNSPSSGIPLELRR